MGRRLYWNTTAAKVAELNPQFQHVPHAIQDNMQLEKQTLQYTLYQGVIQGEHWLCLCITRFRFSPSNSPTKGGESVQNKAKVHWVPVSAEHNTLGYKMSLAAAGTAGLWAFKGVFALNFTQTKPVFSPWLELHLSSNGSTPHIPGNLSWHRQTLSTYLPDFGFVL